MLNSLCELALKIHLGEFCLVHFVNFSCFAFTSRYVSAGLVNKIASTIVSFANSAAGGTSNIVVVVVVDVVVTVMVVVVEPPQPLGFTTQSQHLPSTKLIENTSKTNTINLFFIFPPSSEYNECN